MKKQSQKIRTKNLQEKIAEKVSAFLRKNPNATFKKRQLARLLGFKGDHEYAALKQVMREMEKSGDIKRTGRRKYGSSAAGIPVVEAESPQEKETMAVGTIRRLKNAFFLVRKERDLRNAIEISRKDLAGAKEGEKVLARIKIGRTGEEHAVVVETLGNAGKPDVELRSIAAEYGLEIDFPRQVVEEAEAVTDEIPEEEIRRRLDFRNDNVFTIDPEDAKDFDDAVSIRKLGDDEYELGVHIADVSYYVRPGSALDKEAYRRGTSVYLTSGVIPMLPHKLSNEICSLNPNVDRLTYSVVIHITSTGKVIDYRIDKSIIRSKRRFTYEEVQKIIESQKGDFADEILTMNSVAKTLGKLRQRAGSIDFDLPEAKFVYDEFGRPIEIMKKIRLDSHRLIEELMLLANKLVASHIGKAGVKAKPFIYRVHDAPDPDRIKELSIFVSHLGYKLEHDGTINQKQLQKLLRSVEGKPEEYLVNDIVLRSMAKAVYSEKNIGHFGLAFKYYTHFTSPIRRYPDLIVHRLLYSYTTGQQPEDLQGLKKLVSEVSKKASEAERRAVEAERESVKVKQVQYMLNHVGDEYEGTISGITKFGFFVEINELLIEGLVPLRELDDYYIFHEKDFLVKGRRTGKVYQLGDRVKVKVVRVNMERHEIDFAVL
ncbi:MAG: ribonuclease R [Candidatus Kryptoniota bacterium]